MKKKESPHKNLGLIIESARKSAGFERQSDLAEKIGASQQAVSRWEAGLSRPREVQIPALAAALKLREADLRQAAGYGVSAEVLPETSTVSFDQDVPVDALSPESFERLVEQLVRLKHRDAREVRRAGARGHDQAGIDILAVLADGRRLSAQCKRVTRFGPADVDAAVKKDTEGADIKILALSRTASPQAAAALRKHSGWVLWDKQDLSRIIRELDQQDQIRVIDTFFPGQRLGLLGIPAAGPWQRPDEFFAPFATKFAAFRHDWPLVGRQSDVAALVEKVMMGRGRIVLMEGRGGVGKSRLLKEVVKELGAREPGLAVYFLSASEPLTAAGLENLGTAPKLLVVDDAHDRSDLPLLFDYAARTSFDVRVLVATRPYATARVRGQAGVFALANAIDRVSVEPLSRAETQILAAEVLKAYDGSPALAEPIAEATRDCPLVTVMAARIAATDKLPPALAQDAQAFRDTILGKFAKVITGELASATDQKAITEVMQVIALVQPFGLDDQAFRNLVVNVSELEDHVVSRTLRLLAEGGVIFRRGPLYRLMPDLLGDYIIEQTCIGSDDRLNSLADRVFAAAPQPLLGNVLVNLGRLDWRKNGGDATKSHLVDHLWRALKVGSDYHDSALEAAVAAAYYAPRQALEFVERQIDRKGVRDKLSAILRRVSYHLEFVRPVCELLWEFGHIDERELNRFPEHGIRTLAELCAVEPDKPIAYNSEVVKFGLSLLANPAVFDQAFTPFDFLNGILSGEGHTSSSDGRAVTLRGFTVNYEAVADLRRQVIDAAFGLLSSPSPRIACLAAKFLHDAMRYPMGLFGHRIDDKLLEKYTAEFLHTLERLRQLVANGTLNPVVVIAIADAVSWHAHYAGRGTGEKAKEIMAALPASLEFRVLGALADGWGNTFLGRMDANGWQDRIDKWIGNLVAELNSNYPNPIELLSFMETCLDRLVESTVRKVDSSHVLLHRLFLNRPDFARCVVETAIDRPHARVTGSLGTALFFLLRADVEAGRVWARRLLDSGNARFQMAVAHAYSNPPLEGGALAPADFEIFVRVLGSSTPSVVLAALQAMHRLGEVNPRLAFDMMRHINFQGEARIFDDLFLFFHNDRGHVLAALTEGDAEYLLGQLRSVKELTGHWVEELLSYLSRQFPERTMQFFIERIELAVTEESFFDMRPINYGPWAHVPLRFREADRFRALLDKIWSWMASHGAGDWRFESNAAALFEAVALPVDATVLEFLSAKISTAGKQELHWIASILSRTEPNFVFTHVDFVLSFLEACDRAGRPVRRKGVDALFRACISGIRSSTPGEPTKEDVEGAEISTRLLPRLARPSAAYELYKMIRDHAERNIKEARQDAEFFNND